MQPSQEQCLRTGPLPERICADHPSFVARKFATTNAGPRQHDGRCHCRAHHHPYGVEDRPLEAVRDSVEVRHPKSGERARQTAKHEDLARTGDAIWASADESPTRTGRRSRRAYRAAARKWRTIWNRRGVEPGRISAVPCDDKLMRRATPPSIGIALRATNSVGTQKVPLHGACSMRMFCSAREGDAAMSSEEEAEPRRYAADDDPRMFLAFIAPARSCRRSGCCERPGCSCRGWTGPRRCRRPPTGSRRRWRRARAWRY